MSLFHKPISSRFHIVAATGLSAAMCLALTPVCAFAAGQETITCDISKGSVVVAGDSISYTGTDGKAVEGKKLSGEKIIITGSTKTNTVKVCDWDDATLDITLRNVSIDVSQVPNEEGVGYKSMCAMYLGGESATWASGRVKLNLEGSNTLKSLDYAGLAVPEGEVVTIDAADSSASLTASSDKANAALAAPGIGSPRVNSSPVEPINDALEEFDCGTVIIDGGVINASSTNSPGIGVGQYGSNCTLVINDGIVNAEGAANSAGIGGGQDGATGTVSIHGGTVNATGGQNGAGIGGGYHNDGGIITITGGKVNATGGKFGSGIGGGGGNQPYNHGHALQVTITGGEVTARGGAASAGIGGGAAATGLDKVIVTGGHVKAYGGDADYTEGEAKQMAFVDGKRVMITVGTKQSLSGAGAGIGVSGNSWGITTYTSGDKAGTTSASGTATFGDGKVVIKGGSVEAWGGQLPSNYKQGLFDYQDAEGIGNGGYVTDVTKTSPYADVVKSFTKGTVCDNGEIVFDSVTPAKVTSLAAKSTAKKTVKLTWKGASHAMGYKIAYKVKGAKSWKTTGTVRNDITLKKLQSGKTYQVKVRATGYSKNGAWSATKSIKVK